MGLGPYDTYQWRGCGRLGNYLLAGRMAVVRDPRCTTSSSVSFQAAASANRANAGTDFDPVFFMIKARWFSTVRGLIRRSAAIFLLGCPASTNSMIWC